jgi:hypothetical protein
MSASAPCWCRKKSREPEESMNKSRWIGPLVVAICCATLFPDNVSSQEGSTTDSVWGETMQAGQWRVSIAPYVWATSLDGDIKAGNIDADVDVGFDDILDDLNFAGMLLIDVGNGRFGFSLNTVVARVEDHPADRVDVTNDTANIGAAFYYRALDVAVGTLDTGAPRRLIVEPTIGARWTYARLEINTDLSGTGLARDGIDADRNEQWVDPLVGTRIFLPLTDRWRLSFEGDIGGFGMGSDIAWNLQGYVSWRTSVFGVPTALAVGYRALHQDYEDNDFEYDVTTYGPIIGAVFHF